MSYQDTIDYLYTQLPMFSRVGAAAIKKDLDNTIALCNFLHQPQTKFKTIHVAGTNGKGSSSHMLASIFQEAGYKVGLYTSPHLYDFRERIKVNGQMCSEAFVINFTQKIKPFIEQVAPSFFEITVGMAFDYFALEKCDIAIIETGLGGRLDSTNVIQPELSLITNIGMDHMALLGDSLEAIAFEKAGIIKKNTPVVISEVLSTTKPIFIQKAIAENASIYFAEDLISFTQWKDLGTIGHFEFDTISLDCDLPGIYQSKNIRGVLVSITILKELGWQIPATAIRTGIAHIKKNTGLMGRWECLQEKPKVILDVAHNVHGIHALLEQLNQLQFQNLHIITGMVKDKDVDAVLTLLPKHAKYYFTQSHIPRALPSNELAAKANALGLMGDIVENVNEALQKAKQNAHQEDLILVMGSIFLIAEINR